MRKTCQVLLSLVMVASGAAQAESGGAEARTTLKQWGMAYCLKQHASDAATRLEGERAMDGYFQRGGHDSEEAYREVRAYVDEALKQAPLAVGKQDGLPMALIGCMDLYESAGYARMIGAQDRHIGK